MAKYEKKLDEIGEAILGALDDISLRVLEVFLNDPLQSGEQIARILGVNGDTVRKRLRSREFRRAVNHIEGTLRDNIIELQRTSVRRLDRILKTSQNERNQLEAAKIALVGVNVDTLAPSKEKATALGFESLPAVSALPEDPSDIKEAEFIEYETTDGGVVDAYSKY